MAQSEIKLITADDDLKWSPSLRAIMQEVRVFSTKQAAIAAAKQFGWKSAIKVARRFDTCWIVGKFDFQPDEVAGITFEVLRVPLLRYETGVDGIQRQPVLDTRRAAL